jgi:hypothetical protein
LEAGPAKWPSHSHAIIITAADDLATQAVLRFSRVRCRKQKVCVPLLRAARRNGSAASLHDLVGLRPGAVGFGNYPGVVESNLGSCGNYVGVAATIFGVAQF